MERTIVRNSVGDSIGPNCTRRQFAVGSVLAASGLAGARPEFFKPLRTAKAVIQILLVGGPSQLETWDPKPDAPDQIRGPFRSIATRVPSVRIGEHFPQLAQRLDRVALLRSVYHDEAPIHETGLQFLQSGTTFQAGDSVPHLGERSGRWLVVPRPLGDTGVNLPRCQDGFRNRGKSRSILNGPVGDSFTGALQSALAAIDSGARLVTVNMFDSVFNQVTWDVHGVGSELPTTLDDYARKVCPTFDRGYCWLIDELQRRGMFDEVLVVATGEFGRTPKLNRHGGRDHWPGVWSALLAGGGICPGVYGRSDKIAAEPAANAVHARELAALIADVLGVGSLDRPADRKHGQLACRHLDLQAITKQNPAVRLYQGSKTV